MGWRNRPQFRERRIKTEPKSVQRLGMTRIGCRQGEIVSGCQKEFTIPFQVPIGISPTLIASNNPYRGSVLITNLGVNETVWVGPYYVNQAQGMPVQPGGSLVWPGTSEVWGISTRESILVSVLEVSAE